MWQQQWSTFFWNFYKNHKVSLFMYLFLSGFVGLHGILNSYFTKMILDSLENNALQSWSIYTPALLILGNYEIHNLCWRGINLINLKLTPVIKNRVTHYLFDTVHNKPFHFFQERLSGSIASHITIVSNTLDKLASNTCVRLTRGGVQLIASLIIMGFIHPIFSCIFLFWTLLFVSVSLLLSKKIRRYSNRLAKNQAEVSGKIVDSLANAKAVRIFSRASLESLLLNDSLASSKEAYQKKGWFFLKFYLIQGLSITCLMGAMIYTLIYQRLAGSVSFGDFALILGASFFLTDMVWANTELIDQFNDEIGQCNQSLQTIFMPEEKKATLKKVPLRVNKGEILFENIHFHFHPKSPLFVDKSIKIKQGEKVGIVGRSGGGKSTLINLLLGLYDVKQGRILIDGQDIQKVSRPSLYDSIGVIPQDPSLFHRSLIENIRYGKRGATDEEAIKAAKKAGVNTFVGELSQQYHSLLGERGVRLSGGQRQRIAIARVILKNAPILILDEPTSQLDSLTETFIKDSLHDLMIEKTTIVIAHRLSTLQQMDRILVLEKGQVIEEGHHDNLIKKGGLYKTLWEAQLGGFISS